HTQPGGQRSGSFLPERPEGSYRQSPDAGIEKDGEATPGRGRTGRGPGTQRVTRGSSSSNVLGPIPLTSSRSSTLVNEPPSASRWARIAVAFFSPSPGRVSNSA